MLASPGNENLNFRRNHHPSLTDGSRATANRPHDNRRIELATGNARCGETTIFQCDSLVSMPIARPPVSARPLFPQDQEAFDHALAAASALSAEELVPVNIDVPSAISTAANAIPKIMAFRDEASKLPGFDIAHFDRLQLYTFALRHAHAKFLAASEPLRAIAALRERGVNLRDALYLDAVALAHRGLLDGDRLADFKAKVGYKNLVFDLLGLHALFRESWDKIASRTGVQLADLDEAELLRQQLTDAMGARDQAPGIVAQSQMQRQRNFTLFTRSYDQVRKAISFLRWDHDDLDLICPSLFAGRGGGRRKATAARGGPP